MEVNVGITEYLSNHSGISGVIKQRYSDFIVNEINLDNEVVHLTSLVYKEDNSNIAEANHVLAEEHMHKISEVDQSLIEEYSISADDKLERTKIHEFVKKMHPKLNTETVEADGVKYVLINRKHDTNNKRGRNFGKFCKFVLHKENKSTMEAIEYISKLLRVKSSVFSFAGTKDKRAITCQEVTAQRMYPTKLSGLNKVLKNMALGNFRSCDNPLKLGDLNGNSFQIILRNVNDPDDKINEYMALLRQNGFINYFGMQRFGITEVCNSEIGRYMLKCDWTAAIDTILKPRQEENGLLKECRKVWAETQDPVKAIDALKHYWCIERQLLEGLQRYSERNHVAALSMIPRNMRLMYLHSYQSLIWNKIVSKRIHEFGSSVLLGDLFQVGSSEQIKFVTDENISNVDITDIVHPLPGHDVRHPMNLIKQWHDETLTEDGLNESSFKHKIREYSLPGDYRKIIVRPNSCKWEVLKYDDYQVPLLQTDMDLLNDTRLNPDNGDKFKALKLELMLPTSSYATMAIREVIRQDTSSSHQSTLNIT